MKLSLRRVFPGDDLTAAEALLKRYEADVIEVVVRDFGFVVSDHDIGDGMLTELMSIVTPPSSFYVAEVDGLAVGTGGLRHLGGGVGEIKRMFVDRAARGRGVARTLMNQLLDDGLAAGLSVLRLETGVWMTEAHRLYESVGFVPCDAYAGREMEAVEESQRLARFMELRLPANP